MSVPMCESMLTCGVALGIISLGAGIIGVFMLYNMGGQEPNSGLHD